MNAKDAYTLLETLMDGVNPITGELLPEDHVCHEPAVLRALHKALVALQECQIWQLLVKQVLLLKT